MSLKDAIERALLQIQNDKLAEDARRSQYSQEQDLLHRQYEQRRDEIFFRLTAYLEAYTNKSRIAELFKEAERIVKGDLSINHTSKESVIVKSDAVIMDIYSLTWGKEYIVYDNSGRRRRPDLFDSFSEHRSEWNLVYACIDSNGLVNINGHEIPVAIWENDPTIIETELANAITYPIKKDDVPVSPPQRN